MRIHKEGILTILIAGVFFIILNIVLHELLFTQQIFTLLFGAFSLAFFLFIVSFFRKPERIVTDQKEIVLSPCDGKVVVIEEMEEHEYFHGRRIQVSVFMSPKNVHVNYYPFSGEVKYVKYHPGKHLVAFNPKSSIENERSSVALSNGRNEILIRQIAGILARRIVTYARPDTAVKAGEELGFIKFGSRVDLFFPPGSEISVRLNETVVGAQTIIGKFPAAT